MTHCNQVSFSFQAKKSIVARFDGGSITSDAGLLWLRTLDERLKLTARMADCFEDVRDPRYTRHEILDLIRQRVYGISLGYEDCNDHDTLRGDPAFKVGCGRDPRFSEEDLASQPTLSRFENSVEGMNLVRLFDLLVEVWLEGKGREAPKRIVLDVDATDDETHGHQQLTFFHGYYDHHIYLPLVFHDGDTGDLIAATLRPGNWHAGHGVIGHLSRIVRKIRERWPGKEIEIVFRADAGFALPRVYDYLERENIAYVIGLVTNPRLERIAEEISALASVLFFLTGQKARLIGETTYQADSWSHPRRVIVKAEYLEKGPNTRFDVTTLSGDAESVYDFYIDRGDTENRIKDLKNGLKADRLSCHGFLANMLRLSLHAFSYVLMHEVRRRLNNSDLENMELSTIRLKLLKVGARVMATARHIWFHLASGYPHQKVWEALAEQLLVPARASP
jgi:hypothetical protein